jgi:dihydrodipicolinate synthase/N-acetylneuraminate lyase
MDLGAAGVMIAPPGGMKGDDAIVTYFQDCAEAIGNVPFVLQDFPQANGLFIPVSAMERVASACPACDAQARRLARPRQAHRRARTGEVRLAAAVCVSREAAAEIGFMLERLGKMTAQRTIGAAS